MAVANKPGFTTLADSHSGNLSSLEEIHQAHGGLINNLFEKVLEELAELDRFHKETAPTIFLVYAHKSAVGEANAEAAQQLIQWLKKVRAQLRSDLSPLGTGLYIGYSLDEDGHPAHNILWNQFCLLPKENYNKSVGKVILCCSEVLWKYHQTCLKNPDLKCYYQEIKEAYSISQKGTTQPAAIHDKINQVVNKYLRKDGFHHVLTELVFLDIRKQGNTESGIIPVILNGGSELFESFPGFESGTGLWMDSRLGSLGTTDFYRPLHKLFFKLLKSLYVTNHRIIDGFETCYKNCVSWIEKQAKGAEKVSQEEFSSQITREILNTKFELSKDLSAYLRTAGLDRPLPSLMVPYMRDPSFVGRETIMETIRKAHQKAGQQGHIRIGLLGLGGVGKSQIAIEYSYRVQESTPDTWVFWIHASNATRFEQGYREIATAAKIPGRDDPKNNILQLVYDWLQDEEHGHWLVVLDNADNNNVFFDVRAESKALADYLPQTAHGSILITSRNRVVAQNLVGSCRNVVLVEPMSADDALALLRNRIDGSESIETEERALIEALEYIPLAISQAGACIANRTPLITVATYLELFWQSESNQEYLLSYDEAKDLRRDASIRHPVITTWQISFDQIRSMCPAATDLLALMSMFDQQGIPKDLVNPDKDQFEFKDAMAPLISFSLIRAEIGEQSFEMHRLVQLSIRQWLKREQQWGKWAKKSRNVMEKAFPSGEYETWTTCQILLPHVQAVIQLIGDLDKEDQSKVMRITHRCGWYLTDMGKYEEAEAMNRRALDGYEKVLGAEHPDTLTSVNNLGFVLNRQGKYKEAEAMHRRALVAREKVLGADHPYTLTSVSNLGLVLSSQGKYKEAEAMHRRALVAREVLGAKHPDTLISVSTLGLVLNSQGKYEEAEAMHRRALVAREKVLGTEHPDTLTSVNNLGLVLSSQGKYEEARAMHQRALDGYKKVLGAEHPSTLTSICNLGLVLSSQGKYKEAEAMHRQALVSREKVLGAEHPDTLTSVSNLGLVLSNQGKYKEAETMTRQALVARKKVLGAEHPDMLTSVSNLGHVLNRQGKYKEAEALHRRALDGSEKVLGTGHPDTLTSVSNLGHVLNSQGKYKEAEAMHRRALDRFKELLGAKHPDTLTSVNNLGHVLSNQGKYKEAEAMHRQALEGYEKVLGAKHPYTLTSVSNLGNMLNSQGKYEEAEEMHRRVLEGYEKVLGVEHPYTLISICNLGLVLSSQGKYNEAEAMHRQVLVARKKALGAEHPDMLTSVSNLGHVLNRQGKYKQAKAMHQRT